MSITTRHEGHHHGHDVNRTRDRLAAAAFWYVLCGIAAVLLVARTWRWLHYRTRRYAHVQPQQQAPTSPTLNRLVQAFHGTCHLALRWPGPLAWLSPPPLGKSLLIIAYIALAIILSIANVQTADPSATEPYAFRTGWTALTALPLLFLLVAPWNPLGFVTSTSHGRLSLSWAHRWASLVFMAVSTAHGALFAHQWIRGDMFWESFEINPQAGSGVWAFAVLVWTLLGSVAPVRELSHEVFVVQHVGSAWASLGVLAWHVGERNRVLVWCAVGVFVGDCATRVVMGLLRNVRGGGDTGVLGSAVGRLAVRIGYDAELENIDESTTVLAVRDVEFSWAAGQHVYVWTPGLPLQTPHPFTIKNVPVSESGSGGRRTGQTIHLAMRTKKGFTRRLRRLAADDDGDGSSPKRLRVLLLGPFGKTPDWGAYQTVVLVSASTGASFTVPVLESIIYDAERGPGRKPRRVHALMVARKRSQLDIYLEPLRRALAEHPPSACTANVLVAVTGSRHGIDESNMDPEKGDDDDESRQRLTTHAAPTAAHEEEEGEDQDADANQQLMPRGHTAAQEIDAATVREYPGGRPDVASYLRDAVEGDPRGGDVVVAVCGGKGLIADVRNAVASMALRGLGIGGSNISLHVEEFGL